MTETSMKASVLVRPGVPETAFEKRSVPIPIPTDDQILIRVEGFGLNYADVLARLGLYPDCPKLPTVLGYEVVGRIERIGAAVTEFDLGQRVMAFTRFGGYAEFAVAERIGAAVIPEAMELGKALALVTQYCTAYYCAEEQVRLHAGDHVLIHAAAGGVGTALVQLAKRHECVVYGTASSHKLEHLVGMGVDHPIDYRNVDFAKVVEDLVGRRGLDVIFDAIGGRTTRRGITLLGSGGRMVLFGASQMSSVKNILGKVWVASSFGLYHPVALLAKSKALVGVNMLRIGDNRPWVLQRVMAAVVKLAHDGEVDPVVGREYPWSELAAAHQHLASRQSIGKLAVRV